MYIFAISNVLYSFLRIWVSIWYHFLLDQRASFTIYYSVNLLVMSSHFKKVSENASILPHSWRVSLFSTEVWVNRFSLSTLKVLIHYPLACKVFNRKATVILIFCSSVCNVLFLSVFLQGFLIKFCSWWWYALARYNYFTQGPEILKSVLKFGKSLAIISSNIFLLLHCYTPHILAVQLCRVMSSYTLDVLIFSSALAFLKKKSFPPYSSD